jgi:hypothetical protein
MISLTFHADRKSADATRTHVQEILKQSAFGPKVHRGIGEEFKTRFDFLIMCLSS